MHSKPSWLVQRKTEDSGGDTQSMFVTPAMSTRRYDQCPDSHTLTASVLFSQSVRTKRGETATAKRKPKPLEAYVGGRTDGAIIEGKMSLSSCHFLQGEGTGLFYCVWLSCGREDIITG